MQPCDFAFDYSNTSVTEMQTKLEPNEPKLNFQTIATTNQLEFLLVLCEV